jgi:hypothetical protein
MYDDYITVFDRLEDLSDQRHGQILAEEVHGVEVCQLLLLCIFTTERRYYSNNLRITTHHAIRRK